MAEIRNNNADRFPCDDEHRPNKNHQSIVEKINERNSKLYGGLCECKEMYVAFCRCSSDTKEKKFIRISKRSNS